VRLWREGRAVIPCFLVIFPAVGSASVRPVQVQAPRLDARSLRLFSAGPTCPTCPTKIRGEGERAALWMPNLLYGGRHTAHTGLNLPARVLPARADRSVWLDGVNDDGHFSRPTLRSIGWTTGFKVGRRARVHPLSPQSMRRPSIRGPVFDLAFRFKVRFRPAFAV
jgi:hypothetical protein